MNNPTPPHPSPQANPQNEHARRYQAIWEQLKLTKSCTITAHPTMHHKIKIMVIKEKYKDKEYRQAYLDTPLRIRTEPDRLFILSEGEYMKFLLMPLSHAIDIGYSKNKYKLSGV